MKKKTPCIYHLQVPAQRVPVARTHLQLRGSASDLGKPISPGFGKVTDRSKSSIQDQWTGKIGDKDPVDVCEIGTLPRPTGTVMPVRFLLLDFVCFLVQQQNMFEPTHAQRRAFAIAILCFHSRLLGVLAMIDDDATDWKV